MTGSEAAPAIVRTRGLVQGYGRKIVLSGIDLDLSPGVWGLLGPNGAGKTTLLQTVTTARQPRGGTLQLLTLDPSSSGDARRIRRRLGYLPQNFGYFPSFTVREFVAYVAWLREVPSAAIPKHVDEAIAAVDLIGSTDTKLKHLSGGMLRRAGIAQAIVNKPDFLVLDEPTAGLDPEQRVAFRTLMEEIGRDCVLLIATHLVEDVARVCTGVVLLRDGSIVFSGTPDELEALATADPVGASALERGYAAVMRNSRADRA